MRENQKTPLLEGKVFYGLHFASGIAQYQNAGSDPETIFISETVAKEMNKSFAGRPVFINHIDDLNTEIVANECVGYVVESFFNKSDGFHWCKFVITTEEGLRAIEQNNWKLSNAYFPKSFGASGVWHGADYSKEVVEAEYEHLAIVQNPRYNESVILTPEQFKKYNEEKELELKRLANSKENKGVLSMLTFFKKTKVENALDLENMSVTLPKSKVEVTISKLVNDADEKEMNKEEPKEAHPEHFVKVGDSMMNVQALIQKHDDMCNEIAELKRINDELKKKHEGAEEPEKKEEPKPEEKNDDSEKPQNEEPEKKEEPKKEEQNDDDEDMPEKKHNHFDDLKNAPASAFKNQQVIELGSDMVARGKARYGNN
jgi:hypothetical protein